MIKKFFTAAAFALCALTASAVEVDSRGLTDAQVAEIKAIAARAASENQKAKTADPGTVLTNAAGWGKQAADAAEGFGRAFTIAARELGITVNEFLATPAGKLTAGLIIWKVMGASLVKILFGIFFVGTGLTVARVIYKRLFTKGYEKVEYSRFFGLSTGTKLIRIPKNFGDFREDGEWFVFIVMIGTVALTLAIGGGVFFTF